MYGIVASAITATIAFAALYYPLSGTRLGWLAALAGGLVAGLGVYFGIAIFVNRRLRALLPEVERALGSQRVDAAIELLERARRYAAWQLMLDRLIDGQVGVILYTAKQDHERARPLLERALPNNWQAKAMLAAYHFERKDDEKARQIFEESVKANKDAGMLWSAYAWCEWRRGRNQSAIDILQRAQKHLPGDDAITRNLQALHTGKKMKMSAYEPEWWALQLQRPPVQMVMPGRRGGMPSGPVPPRIGGGRRFRGR